MRRGAAVDDVVLCMGVVVALAIAMVVPITHSQMVTPTCSPTMISSFSPCLSFVNTNSTRAANNATTTPSADCCNSIKSLANTGMSCFCLIATGAVPFQLPVNQTLALTLPRACNMPPIPFQCKASGAPTPAPGPSQLGPSPSPAISPSSNPQAAAPSPTTGGVTMTPPPPPAADSGSPPTSTTTPPGSPQVLKPSSPANRLLSYSAPSSAALLMFIVLGFGVCNV